MSRGSDLGISPAETFDGVRVAAGDLGLARQAGHIRGVAIGGGQHLAVAGFHCRKDGDELLEIGAGAGAGQAGEGVIHAEQQAALLEVSEQGREVLAAALHLEVIAVLYAIDAHVQLGPAGGAAGNFLAQEKIRVAAQALDRADGVVIGDGDQLHAAALEGFVDLLGVAITFAANPVQDGHGAHAGVDRILAKLDVSLNAYYLNEEDGWQPDLEDIKRKITPRTRGIVLINPNNPTGSVCTRAMLEEIAELARRHNLIVFADEIYDKLIIDDDVQGEAPQIAIAAVAPDVPVITFGGLSKNYLAPGWRIGWGIASGEASVIKPYLEGVNKLLRARLCANHPEQYAIPAALEGPQDHLTEVKRKLRSRRDLTQ